MGVYYGLPWTQPGHWHRYRGTEISTFSVLLPSNAYFILKGGRNPRSRSEPQSRAKARRSVEYVEILVSQKTPTVQSWTSVFDFYSGPPLLTAD